MCTHVRHAVCMARPSGSTERVHHLESRENMRRSVCRSGQKVDQIEYRDPATYVRTAEREADGAQVVGGAPSPRVSRALDPSPSLQDMWPRKGASRDRKGVARCCGRCAPRCVPRAPRARANQRNEWPSRARPAGGRRHGVPEKGSFAPDRLPRPARVSVCGRVDARARSRTYGAARTQPRRGCDQSLASGTLLPTRGLSHPYRAGSEWP